MKARRRTPSPNSKQTPSEEVGGRGARDAVLLHPIKLRRKRVRGGCARLVPKTAAACISRIVGPHALENDKKKQMGKHQHANAAGAAWHPSFPPSSKAIKLVSDFGHDKQQGQNRHACPRSSAVLSTVRKWHQGAIHPSSRHAPCMRSTTGNNQGGL